VQHSGGAVVIDAGRFASPVLDGLQCRVMAFNERTMRGGIDARQLMKSLAAPDTKVVVALVGCRPTCSLAPWKWPWISRPTELQL
jgi:hypothetical protein